MSTAKDISSRVHELGSLSDQMQEIIGETVGLFDQMQEIIGETEGLLSRQGENKLPPEVETLWKYLETSCAHVEGKLNSGVLKYHNGPDKGAVEYVFNWYDWKNDDIFKPFIEIRAFELSDNTFRYVLVCWSDDTFVRSIHSIPEDVFATASEFYESRNI